MILWLAGHTTLHYCALDLRYTHTHHSLSLSLRFSLSVYSGVSRIFVSGRLIGRAGGPADRVVSTAAAGRAGPDDWGRTDRFMYISSLSLSLSLCSSQLSCRDEECRTRSRAFLAFHILGSIVLLRVFFSPISANT